MSSFVTSCRFLATTGGTGSFVVASAVAGHVTPESDSVANGKTYHYYAQTPDGSQTEEGHGVYTIATHTLSRVTIDNNSDGTLVPINFAVAPEVDVFPSATPLEVGSSLTTINFIIDGGASVITTGMKGYLSCDFAGIISQAELLADVSGSIVVNIWKCTYAQFDAGSTHPVVGDKITASAPPTITTATKSQDATLTGWTTAFNAGDIFGFNVDSVATIKRCTVALKVLR